MPINEGQYTPPFSSFFTTNPFASEAAGCSSVSDYFLRKVYTLIIQVISNRDKDNKKHASLGIRNI